MSMLNFRGVSESPLFAETLKSLYTTILSMFRRPFAWDLLDF